MKNLKKYLPKKNQIKNTAEALYWNLYYTIGYSSVAGLGNGITNLENNESFSNGFGKAYTNNFLLGLVINSIYPIAFKQFQKSKYYRLYANLFTLGINLGFLAWHYYTKTENPLETMIPTTTAGLIMANKHVSETKKLEEKLMID